MTISQEEKKSIQKLCEKFREYNSIDPALYEKYDVKRGLRNADGTGVLAGLTKICNVKGYIVSDNEREPVEGKLTYRGMNIYDLVDGFTSENRFGFEEITYLLLFGYLPNKAELTQFSEILSSFRELPPDFAEDMIFKAPSRNIMNKLARSVLALYSYDENAEDTSLESEMGKAIKLIARMPTIMGNAYQVKRRHYDQESMFFHRARPEESVAEGILSTLRADRQYTDEEAKLLDLCLVLHAEHGGGNNSTFTCRTLTSTGTDAYSAYAGAISSLKGRKHGGANLKVVEMINYFRKELHNFNDREEIRSLLEKIIDKEFGDRTGLVYGMGHAVYTLSDPRAVILKQRATELAEGTEFEATFQLLNTIEELTPVVFAEKKKSSKEICANVDMYSGFVYEMLKIPYDLFTPLFAVARMSGWAAHRMEELIYGGRIIRPGYKAVIKSAPYIKLESRG